MPGVRRAALVALVAVIPACGGSSATDEPAPDCTLPPAEASCDAYREADVQPLVNDCWNGEGGFVVPKGSYWEPTGVDALFWFAPCADGLEETRTKALLWASESNGYEYGFLSERETPYFFEVALSDAGSGSVFRYRKTRCDYFDGKTLAGAPFESTQPLDALAGYLWFTDVHSHRALLAMLHPSPAPLLETSMCHARVNFELLDSGGVCESVELLQSDFALDPATGEVTMTPAATVRSFPATCK